MTIGETEGKRLIQHMISNGMTEKEAEQRLAFLRGAKSVYIGRKSALDDLGNTYYNY